jgi:hypothetical protein
VEEKRDYSSLVGYGEMRTILGPLDNPSVDWDACVRKFLEFAGEVQDGDYILWAGGDPASAFLMGLQLGYINSMRVKWLRWDKRTDSNGDRTKFGYYVPVEFRT